jgi:DnaJ-class molecular chaperone
MSIPGYDGPYDEPPDEADYEEDKEWACTWCGGDGVQDNDDPLWYGFDTAWWIPCEYCGGTGLRKHQTIF